MYGLNILTHAGERRRRGRGEGEERGRGKRVLQVITTVQGWQQAAHASMRHGSANCLEPAGWARAKDQRWLPSCACISPLSKGGRAVAHGAVAGMEPSKGSALHFYFEGIPAHPSRTEILWGKTSIECGKACAMPQIQREVDLCISSCRCSSCTAKGAQA